MQHRGEMVCRVIYELILFKNCGHLELGEIAMLAKRGRNAGWGLLYAGGLRSLYICYKTTFPPPPTETKWSLLTRLLFRTSVGTYLRSIFLKSFLFLTFSLIISLTFSSFSPPPPNISKTQQKSCRVWLLGGLEDTDLLAWRRYSNRFPRDMNSVTMQKGGSLVHTPSSCNNRRQPVTAAQ